MKVIDVLECRKSFHAFIDPMWKYGRFARDYVYKQLSNILNKEAHVSTMSVLEMEKCAKVLLQQEAEAYPCHICNNCIALRYFFPVCKKNIERRYCNCEHFEPKR